ncbi:MAG: hypothetical protein V4685_01760 [Bacteroidota bacterium]
MAAFLILLALFIITPVVLMIIGIVFLSRSDSQVKRKGRNFLLAGLLLILIEILIGYSVCSNLSLH